MNNNITWLHLSDLHYCEAKTGWDAFRVLTTMKKDLKKMQDEHSLHPDFIFFTGDVAFGQIGTEEGNQLKEQLKGAAGFFNEVRRTFDPEIPIENVFLVPGNHDVNRERITEDQTLWLDHQQDVSKINALLHENSLQWKRFIERLEDYRSFIHENFPHLLSDPDRLTYSLIREIRGLKIRIIGLNSAWSSSRDREKGRLWMGSRWQMEDALRSVDPVDLSISLMHHPSNWLVEYEDPQLGRFLERDLDFSLHGHEHQEWVTQTPSHVRIAAGACYEASERDNGYNFVSLDLAGRTADIWLRRYHSAGGGWVPEAVPDRTDNNGVWQVNDVGIVSQDRSITSISIDSAHRELIQIDAYHIRPTEHIFRAYGSDLRPVVDAWVGREAELQSFEKMTDGVVVVTGIGGQGKSFLVAKFLEAWVVKNPDSFWDWRDCKEEGERFFSQLVALIEHLTDGRVMGDHLLGADQRAAVRYFFELVGNQRGVIVLDNVDHYVHQLDKKFRLGVEIFVEEALRVAPNLLVILTCRPHISYGSHRYLEIPLRGIELDEAVDLFRLRGVNAEANSTQIEELWERTAGHPMWLNLIATQMARNPQTGPNILQELKKGRVDDQTRSMFRALLSGLNERQRTILRCMAEVHYPETRDSIQNFVGGFGGSRNQFIRAFEGLRALNLVVERGSSQLGNTFDLHPLVRSFVRTEYPSQHERLPILKQILLFLGSLIEPLDKPSENAPLEDLQRWSAKAELEMETGNRAMALRGIARAADQLIARGFHEEFFRVAKPILEAVNWSSIESQDAADFHEAVTKLISSLAEHNRVAEAREYLLRYGKSAGTTVGRLRFLKEATHLEWLVGNHAAAIAFGNEGVALKKESDIDTTIAADTSYYLALALRDSGKFDDALRILAPDLSVDEILSRNPQTSGESAPFYGNVGRCLQFKGEFVKALKCYVKSAVMLQATSGSEDILNRGYAALWIGEVLQSLGDLNNAFCSYRVSVHVWSQRSPLRVGTAIERLKEISKLVSEDLCSISDTEATNRYKRWLDEFVQNQ